MRDVEEATVSTINACRTVVTLMVKRYRVHRVKAVDSLGGNIPA